MNILHPFRDKPNRFIARLGRATKLEIIGLMAIALLIINILFDFTVTVRRKPLLAKLLGQSSNPAAASANQTASSQATATDKALEAEVLPSAGVELPVTWGNLGKQLVESGVIDQQKFADLYASRGGLDAETQKLLSGDNNDQLKITAANSGTLLNLLWAFGLGNKNDILTKGEMSDPKFGGAAGFASTGGWTLARGEAMDHFSKHALVTLTSEQQALVDRVSQGIYRPCCGNSTHFPDCNHGMAMLGLLELAASQGVNEETMYKMALAVNSYWFPDTYLTIAKFIKGQGGAWSQVDPRAVLDAPVSSAQGYKQILDQVQPVQPSGSGGGCGV